MNRIVYKTIPLVLALFTAGGAYAEPVPGAEAVPAQIGRYYGTLNFIALNSTLPERILLSDGAAPRGSENMIDPQRSAALRAAMAAVERMELEREPGMPNPFERHGPGPDSVRWTATLAYSVPEIDRISSRYIVLRVRQYHFDPRSIRFRTDGAPSPGHGGLDPAGLPAGGGFMGEEIHEWVLTSGGWKRKPFLYMLLGSGRS